MNEAARFRRLQEVFETLIALPADARDAWLAEHVDDADLAAEARALVAAEDADAGVTRRIAAASAQAAARRPADQRLGAYRLLEEIGSGGMGTVFLAERVDENFDQLVAIKLLRGLPTREATERMRRERQILADLSHPHIARLLDGGNTLDGQPYLVMEYVDGIPLNAFCRREDLGVPARLKLMQKVCAAVQYAHQRLVIHRDLKPANVLVRTDGEPVLLDFGIAKLMVDTGAPAQQTGLAWFTPAYASPEQRDGRQVSTATDIYGLGVLLREILTGNAPGAEPRGGDAATTRRRLGGDLELIVAKATHAEPERRYVSAAALSDDLQRHLRGRPIHAAPDRLHYRLRKFVGRHRWASAAVAAALALSAFFIWRLALERDRALRAEALAQQQTATAESVVDYLVSLFRSASPEETGTRPLAPRDLVDRGRKEIDARLAGAPEQHARLLGAFGRIYTELGLGDAAAEALGRAAEIERDHGTPQRRAAYLADLGYALNLAERPAAAETALREAESALGTIEPDERKLAAELLSTLGIAQARNGDAKGGIATLNRALAFAAAGEGEASLTYAQGLYGLAETEMRANRLDDAETHALRSVELMRTLRAEDSFETQTAIGFLSQVYEAQGRYADDERLLRHMLDVRLRTLDPGSDWAITERNNLAQAIQLQGRTVEATRLMQENLDRLRAKHQERTPSYFISLNNVASLLEQAGDYATSLAMFEEVLGAAKAEASADDDPRMPTYVQNYGRSLLLNGRLDAAMRVLAPKIEGPADSVNLNIERGRRLVHLAEWMRRSARYDEALAYVDEAARTFSALYPQEHARHGAVARIRGLILRDRKNLDDAESELRRAAGILSRTAGTNANSTIEAELQLAQVLLARGHREEARRVRERFAPLLAERFVEHATVREQDAELARRLDAEDVATAR